VRRWRWALGVGGFVLLFALLIALTTPGSTQVHLDPDNTGRGGTRAVAEVLRQQGVEVRRVTTVDAAVGVADRGSTLVVVNPDLLDEGMLDRLGGTGADLVLVQPGLSVLSHLDLDITVADGTATGRAEPRCDLPAARTAGRIRSGGRLYRLTSPAGEGAVCYPGRGPATRGTYVSTERSGHRVLVLGQSDVLVNEHVSEDGNAALALHSLGANEHLVWLVPDPLALGVEDPPTVLELLPAAVRWLMVPLLLAVLSALYWRSRRMGRLVAEPLPVVVRSVETHEGRARLYRRAGARDRAAATLRTAALRRIAARLALTSAETTPEQVAEVAAATAELDGQRVRATLLGPAPADDAALVRLAEELDTLEKALNRPAATGPAATREVHP
jgi:hypothetical protein